jgi:hypothetical protein
MHFGEVIKGVCVLFEGRNCEVMNIVRRDFCDDEKSKKERADQSTLIYLNPGVIRPPRPLIECASHHDEDDDDRRYQRASHPRTQKVNEVFSLNESGDDRRYWRAMHTRTQKFNEVFSLNEGADD